MNNSQNHLASKTNKQQNASLDNVVGDIMKHIFAFCQPKDIANFSNGNIMVNQYYLDKVHHIGWFDDEKNCYNIKPMLYIELREYLFTSI